MDRPSAESVKSQKRGEDEVKLGSIPTVTSVKREERVWVHAFWRVECSNCGFIGEWADKAEADRVAAAECNCQQRARVEGQHG